MAIPVNIDDLINHRVVESTRIEYKSDFNPNPIIRSICAFANDIDNMGGGYIIIGVEESNGAPLFPIKGIAQGRIDGILKKLREYCHFIGPLYQPVTEPMRSHLKETGSNLYPYSLTMDTLQIAKNMQIVDGPEENLKPLNVGILMF